MFFCSGILEIDFLRQFFAVLSDHIAERDETETADRDWGTDWLRNNILSLQANTVKTNEEEKYVTRMVLLNNFMFVLRNLKTDSVILFGKVSTKST